MLRNLMFNNKCQEYIYEILKNASDCDYVQNDSLIH